MSAPRASAYGRWPPPVSRERYAVAFRVGAALMVLGGALIVALFERVTPELRDPAAEIAEVTR